MKANQTVGSRIRSAREKAELTQQELATYLGLSRAAVAQWETDVTSPSIAKVFELSRLMTDTTAEYLAFGVTDIPKVIYQTPDGTTTIPEITYGDSAASTTEVGQWSIPTSYLRGDLHVLQSEGIVVWRVESASMTPSYEFGDRVIVDTNSRKASPPGMFLIWDGIAVCLANISVVQITSGGKQMARVTTGADQSYEVPVDKLIILGRVKGRLHAS